MNADKDACLCISEFRKAQIFLHPKITDAQIANGFESLEASIKRLEKMLSARQDYKWAADLTTKEACETFLNPPDGLKSTMEPSLFAGGVFFCEGADFLKGMDKLTDQNNGQPKVRQTIGELIKKIPEDKRGEYVLKLF